MEILILVLTVVISIIVVASVIAARIQLKNTKHFSEIQQSINDRQVQNLLSLQETLRESLAHQSKELAGKFDKLTDTADQKLQQISGQVEKRLSDGF